MADEYLTVDLKPTVKPPKAKAYGFPTGTYEADPRNPGKKREVLCWVGERFVQDNGDGTYDIVAWLVRKEPTLEAHVRA